MGAGTYVVSFRDVQWAQEIVVPDAGVEGVSIRVPDPVDVAVLLKARDGRPLPEGLGLRWNPVTPARKYGGMLLPARRDHASGAYRFRAPSGEIGLSLTDFTLELVDPVLEVRDRTMKASVEVLRRSGFVIVLMDGDRVLKWIGPWFDRAVSIDGGERHTGWASANRGKLIQVGKPGRYRVHLRKISGYEPVEPQLVDVAAGTFPELVIPLRRVR